MLSVMSVSMKSIQLPPGFMWGHFYRVVIFTFIVAMIINYILYSLSLAMDLPMGDHWRWIRGLLIPLVDGRIGFWEYVTGEFYPMSHSHMVTLFFVWANFHLFDLDYRLEFYIGLLSHIALMVWMSWIYFRSMRERIGNVSALIIVVVFLAIMLNPRNVIAWSLVQFEYLYLLGAFSLLVAFASYLEGKFPFWGLALIIPVCFFLGDAMGISAMMAIIAYIVVFEIKTHHRLLVSMLIAIALSYIAAHILVPDMHSHTNMGKLDALIYLLNNPLDTISFLLKVCAQTLTEKASLKYAVGAQLSQPAQYAVGSFVLLFISVALFLYFRYRKSMEISPIPMLMILFAVATATGVMLSRLPSFGPDVAQAGRYVRLFQFGFVGALWINLTVLIDLIKRSEFPRSFLTGVSVGLILFLLFGYVAHSAYLWKYHGAIVKNRQNAMDSLRAYGDDFGFDIGAVESRCKSDFCKPSIIFLKERELSLFRNQ